LLRAFPFVGETRIILSVAHHTRRTGDTTMIFDTNILNALADQKNDIAARIDFATEPAVLEELHHLITFAAPLWDALEYGYKTKELKDRLRNRANHLILVERAYLAECRKNDRTRVSTEKAITWLEQLAE
jgi:hypothetical protein